MLRDPVGAGLWEAGLTRVLLCAPPEMGGCCSATGLADFLPGELGLVLGLSLGLELKEIEQVVLNAAAICDADLLPDLRPGGGGHEA